MAHRGELGNDTYEIVLNLQDLPQKGILELIKDWDEEKSSAFGEKNGVSFITELRNGRVHLSIDTQKHPIGVLRIAECLISTGFLIRKVVSKDTEEAA